MQQMSLKLFSLMIAAALTNSCGTESGVSKNTGSANASEKPQKSAMVCPSGTLLTYENFGQGFMENYCTSCHSRELSVTERGGAPENANFEQKDDIAVWRFPIYSTMFSKVPTMPPQTEVPAYKLQLMNEWLRCGAP